MGSVCSSGNSRGKRKKGKNRRGSLTSSSDAAVDMGQAKRVTIGGGEGGNTRSSYPVTCSNSGTPTIPDNFGRGTRPQSPGPGMPVHSADIGCPNCVVPRCLNSVPVEMQNLLMGRWPVPPTPDSRVLRLFVAAEEMDSQLERTALTLLVYPGLRHFTEDLGFHLHVVDIHALLPTHCTPEAYLRDIAIRAMADNVDIWLIHLNSKIGWRLPTTIGTTDFQDLHKKLAEKNPKAAQGLSETYTLDENNIPPAYWLLPVPGGANHLQKRQELFDELCHVVTESQDEMYMNEGFPTEITTALAHHAGMSDNIIVTHRTIYNLPKDKTDPVNKLFLDIDTEGETNQHLLKKHRYLNTRVERIVSNECIMKWSLSWEEMETALEGQETPQVKSLCQKLENKLKAAVERISERQASVNPYLAEGLPPVLCQELVMHAHKQQQLLTNMKDMPHIVEPALQQLYSNPSVPLVLQGPVGSGMQTVGSFLALQEAKRDLPRLVALRFMTLTPESQTVMAALFTVLEQVSIAFGVNKVFKDIKSLSLLEMIASIGACTTKEVVSIILCSVRWGMLGRGNEVEWIRQKLPPNVHLIVLTNCPTLSQNISVVQIPPMKPEQVEKFLLDRLKLKNRCLTKNQHDAAISVLSKNPLPVLAVLVAELATEWTSDTVQRPEELPTSMEEALVHLFKQAEKVVGVESVARILSYLSTAKFGLSDSELEDVLAMDDTLLSSIYPDRCPKVRRCPLSIWLYLKHKFAAVMDIAYVYGHRVYRWQRQVTGALVLERYDINPVPLHMLLTEYFRGKWASEPKPLPDPDKPEQTVAVPCAVIEQPNCFNRNTNCRKFLCLLYHMLQGISMPSEQGLHERRCAAAKQHLLDIRWLVTKLDATSLVQLLDDLQMAIYAASTMSTELTWLQLLVARNAHVLTVSGRQLHSRLHMQLMFERHLLQGGSPKGYCSPDKARRASFQAAISRFEQAVTNSPVPFLASTDSKDSILHAVSSCESSEYHETLDSKVKSKSESLFRKPEASLNGFYSYSKDCRRVVSISTEAGEIVVWDTVNHRAVQTLRGIAKPSGLVFLDVNHVVVLCNRELKAFDLKEGVLTSDIRGMLNIKMPYFHVRDSETVIVLARNRMSVNVLDVKSGQIHATFKAGEDRFLNSLLVSGNGKILVCGDETQKPFPLLVWELGQSKLLHDLRMPQHEFITSIADITWNGHYVACGCRGLYDHTNNFVVVYDLLSGQLYRQFRMAGSVTSLAVASNTLHVVMTLNDGSMVVYDIQSGNCKFDLPGVKATYNKLRLSTDEMQAVTYSVDAGVRPIACTVALWDIGKGQFQASFTFDDPVTACLHVAHSNSILVGLTGSLSYCILSLYPQNADSRMLHIGVHDADPDPDGRSSFGEQPLWRLV